VTRVDLDPRNIPDTAREAAARWGDAEGMVDGERRWTFREIEADMLRSVNAARRLGIQPGDRVVVWAPIRPNGSSPPSGSTAPVAYWSRSTRGSRPKRQPT